MQIRKNNVPYRIDMHLKKKSQRGLPSMGFPYAKASELFGIANVVFFFAGGSEYHKERAIREEAVH